MKQTAIQSDGQTVSRHTLAHVTVTVTLLTPSLGRISFGGAARNSAETELKSTTRLSDIIALARPDLKVTLIEPLQRRVDFLTQVIAELELPIKVVRGRAEAVKMQFEVVTARAVAPLEKLIQISWHMIPRGGCLLAIKGESAAEELAATKLKKGSTAKLHEISLPNLPVARVVEVLKGA